MDFKLILLNIVLIIIFNSLLLFFLFWYFFKKKHDPTVETQHRCVSKTNDSDSAVQTNSAKTTAANTKTQHCCVSTKEKNRFKSIIFSTSILLSLGIIYFFNFRHGAKTGFAVAKNPQVLQKPEFYYSPDKINPRGLNLIFFADSYQSWEDFDNDIANLMIGIKQIEPWKTYSNYNIYKINPGMETQLCQVKTENERKPVLRCTAEINNYLEKLHLENFRLIVLSRQDFQSWANVTRIENSGIFFSVKDKINESSGIATSYLFAHLLGHFFGLKDEEKYVIAKADGAPHTPDGPNCAPDEETAKKWWGDLAQKYPDRVGYFKTCAGSDDYIKPTESSLMNFGNMDHFIPDYGPVSEAYLKKILDYCFSEKKVTQDQDGNFFEQYSEMKACL
ncbi:MAG: hypothetical protein WCO05_03995 [Candidatus Moraniibacteriota bacterium]